MLNSISRFPNLTKLTDFGSAKILNDPEDNEPDPLKRKASFVGTAEYCSPELLNDKSLVAGPSSDIWGLGCILFQLLVGYTPFKGSNEYQTFQKIITLNYRIPDQLESSSKDLIAYILQLAPERRPSLKAIKDSSFFEDFKWKELPCSTPPISTPIPALPGGQKLDDLPSRLENIQFDDETSSNSSREE